MSLSTYQQITGLANIDLFAKCKNESHFIGRPFYFDYGKVFLLVNDRQKKDVGGIPEGCFLICTYDHEPELTEVVLVRVIGPTKLPTDNDTIASMVDYYKESAPTATVASPLDSFTRYEFQFSGLECRVLGTFYKVKSGDNAGKVAFGSDIENFYSANNYSAFKPAGKVLEYIVNFKEDGGVIGGKGDTRIGQVRYASTIRTSPVDPVTVFVKPTDFLAKRTALFGMTRTGKSNTVKKIIQCVEQISGSGIEYDGEKLSPVGQIIFDVNGEYANPNRQDGGTAIYELYADKVTRYSTMKKDDFKVMKLNFYRDVEQGLGMLQTLLAEDTSDYIRSFRAMDLSLDEDFASDFSYTTRRDRRVAAYLCCLKKAGFKEPSNFTLKFKGCKTDPKKSYRGLNDLSGRTIDPSLGISLDEATAWFEAVWREYSTHQYIQEYRQENSREWADDDLKLLLRILSLRNENATVAPITGYRKFGPAKSLHTETVGKSFESEIVDLLREGQIIIVDLSEGDPSIQRTYSERICQRIFADSMRRFISNPNNAKGTNHLNFIQMYFEEAHNLFPKKEDKDLSQIYNRLAKEGAKLRISVNYATQEVSSISSNILKNTQNWFISHLNNRDELQEIEKFYDFADFTDSLMRATDKGFIRMKTYSNAFIVPVQVDRFKAAETSSLNKPIGGQAGS